MKTVPGKLVKAVFQRVLFPDLSADLITALAGAGVDLSNPLHDEYEKPIWYGAIQLTADSLFPEAPHGQRLRKLGRHLIEALDERKLVKGPWLSMAKLMGPKRALKQGADMGAQYSPIHLAVKERGSKELQITVAEDGQPEFLAGLLEGLVHVLGGKAPHVKVESVAHGHAVMAATWR